MNVSLLHDDIKPEFDIIFVQPASGVRSTEVKLEQLLNI